MNKVLRSIPGIRLKDNKAQVNLWAPLAKDVALVVNHSKEIALTSSCQGYWSALSDQLQVGDRYQFRIDGKEYPDPASLSQPEGVHAPSEIIDLERFQWTDNAWNNLPLEDYIIYELHVGTFTPGGTFEAIEAKLDYLLQLGITAIELMPVAQFPGERNWGYDGAYPFAVQHSYGGAKGLQHLVNACHEKGLAVILDVVYNHLGPEGAYLGSLAPYFTDKYNTPWGKAINFDDAWCDGVREFFINNALMWFRDFHIDALRLDAVHAIKDMSPVHILKEIRLHVDAWMQDAGKKHYLIVESDLNDPRFIDPISRCGYGMDAQWVDEFHHALRVAASGEQYGYYSDFKGLEHLCKSYTDAYVYDGQYSEHRKKRFGARAANNPGHQFIVFSQNHDQVGNRMLGERTSQLFSFEMQKLLAAAVICSPYIPLLFMGEEWAAPHPFQYFVDHSDPELVEGVRKGRREEFAAFHFQGEAPDPISKDVFELSTLQWDLLEQDKHATMLQYYKTLLDLRKNHPVLKELNRKNVEVACDEVKQLIQLHRWHYDESLWCLMNFSGQVQKLTIPGSDQWFTVLNSADPQWKCSQDKHGEDRTATGTNEYILAPASIALLGTRPFTIQY
ncbi:MAG TPA: malto-oligosyltrehalose trehalohydrolase [Flavisolibacter sp.]|nr:malto-oligosyltrehalose trehalohydrolase [Flavisolibacter sp.]